MAARTGVARKFDRPPPPPPLYIIWPPMTNANESPNQPHGDIPPLIMQEESSEGQGEEEPVIVAVEPQQSQSPPLRIPDPVVKEDNEDTTDQQLDESDEGPSNSDEDEDQQQQPPAPKPIFTLNVTSTFNYSREQFTTVRIPEDVHCLYRAVSHFATGSINHHALIREEIYNLYVTLTPRQKAIMKRFIWDPVEYANRKDKTGKTIRDKDGAWGTRKEIKAAATLFQQSVYVFDTLVMKRGQKVQRHVIRRYDPFFKRRALWEVKIGEPPVPVVFECTKSQHGYYLHQSLVLARDREWSMMPQLTAYNYSSSSAASCSSTPLEPTAELQQSSLQAHSSLSIPPLARFDTERIMDLEGRVRRQADELKALKAQRAHLGEEIRLLASALEEAAEKQRAAVAETAEKQRAAVAQQLQSYREKQERMEEEIRALKHERDTMHERVLGQAHIPHETRADCANPLCIPDPVVVVMEDNNSPRHQDTTDQLDESEEPSNCDEDEDHQQPPAAKPIFTLCVTSTFNFSRGQFTTVQIPGDANCLYRAVSHFAIGSINHHEIIREEIYNLYVTSTQREKAIIKQFIGDPVEYANRKDGTGKTMRDNDGAWGTRNEIKAAATLFQQSVYVFHTVVMDRGRKVQRHVVRYDPFFKRRALWKVKIGEPPVPLVLECTKLHGYYMHQSLVLACGRGLSTMPQLTAYSSSSDAWVAPLEPMELQYSPQSIPLPQTALARFDTQRIMDLEGRVRRQAEELKSLKERRSHLGAENRLLASALAETAEKQRAAVAQQLQSYRDKQERMEEEIRVLKHERNTMHERFLGQAHIPHETRADCENPKVIKVRPKVAVGGRSRSYHCIIQASAPVGSLLQRGLIDRVENLDEIIVKLAGSEEPEQKAHLLRGYLKRKNDVRNAIVTIGEKEKDPIRILKSRLSDSETVDLIHEANLTGSQVRIICSYLHHRGLNPFAPEYSARNEHKTRERKHKLIQEVVKLRALEQQGGSKKRAEIEVEAVCLRAPNLVQWIKESYERACEHMEINDDDDQVNFQQQIHFALGGDKGGGYTKIVGTFGNFRNPSSFNNLHILAMYEGDDSAENLRRILINAYQSEWETVKMLHLPKPLAMKQLIIDQRQKPLRRKRPHEDTRSVYDEIPRSIERWPLRLQLFGDLQFLSHFMGHKGAASKQPCLWCHVSNQALKRVKPDVFTELAQCDPRKLEEWYQPNPSWSIKEEPIFPIRVDNIILPVLHTILGIGTWAVKEIENAAMRADLKMKTVDGAIDAVWKRLDAIIADDGDNDEELQGDETTSSNEASASATSVTTASSRAVEFNAALAKIGVDRRAFRGGVIVGNHVKKMLTGDNPSILTNCLRGTRWREPFKLVLIEMGKVMRLMGAARFLTDEEISELETACAELGKAYETLASTNNDGKDDAAGAITISPKLHIIVNHVPEYARRNRTVGLISEHGLESMHARLNRVGRRLACVRNISMRMTAMVKQHEAEQPAGAKRRRKK